MGSTTLKSLEEEKGRHIKALCLQGLFPPILPLLLAWGPLAWGRSPLPGSGPVGEHADWASEPGRAGSHPGSGIPGCVASGPWLTLARPRLEKSARKNHLRGLLQALAGKADARGVLPVAEPQREPFLPLPSRDGSRLCSQSPQACLLSPQGGDPENPPEHRGMREKEPEQRPSRRPAPHLTVDWYTRSSRLR